MTDTPTKTHQLVGFFEDQTELEKAINDLQSVGVDRSQLSMLSRRSFEEHDPQDVSDVADLAMSPERDGKPATSEVDIRQGRTMVSGMAGAVGGTAAGAITLLTGAAAAVALPIAAAAGVGLGFATHLAGRKASEAETASLREQLEHGGIVLWVTARNESEEEKAIETLKGHGVRRLAVDGVEET
jgi:hypothetical protein